MADDNDASKKSGNQDPPKGIISEVANNLGPVYRHLFTRGVGCSNGVAGSSSLVCGIPL
jgi:hypothetical protein